jgi:hypothetical protein
MFSEEKKTDVNETLIKKKLCSFSLDFELATPEQAIQGESALESFKYLYLLQAVIANQVASETLGGSPRDQKSQVTVKTDSCVKSKYDDYKQTDVFHANFSVDAVPIYDDSKACEIVAVENPDAEH